MNPSITVICGSLAKQSVDALILPVSVPPAKANSTARDVDHTAGPLLSGFLKGLGVLEPGHVEITPGFDLPAQFVIHVAPPELPDGLETADQYRQSWEAVIERLYDLVLTYGLRSLAIPPLWSDRDSMFRDYALRSITKLAVRLHAELHCEVILVSETQAQCDAWEALLRELQHKQDQEQPSKPGQ